MCYGEEDDCCCEHEPVDDPNDPDCGRPEVSCVYCCSQGNSQDNEETPGHAENKMYCTCSRGCVAG